MKQFQKYVIGLALAASLVILLVLMAVAGWFFLKARLSLDEPFAAYNYMATPLFVFFFVMGINLIVAIIFGFQTTALYSRDRLFERPMERGLERTALAFLTACLAALLEAIYILLNVQSVFVASPFLLLVCLFLLASQLFFLLSDVIRRGRVLREENDLTI
ncbi:MAG: DUF2975 domain-containing protein [Firmicutes bacterium]|nr:DUF2975 domain-containing protein [Bacillota bacterium]